MKLDRAEIRSIETADLEPKSAKDYYDLGNQQQRSQHIKRQSNFNPHMPRLTTIWVQH